MSTNEIMTKDKEQASSVVSSSHAAMVVTLPLVTSSSVRAQEGIKIEGSCIENNDSSSEKAMVTNTISSVRGTHATLQSLLAAPISAARIITQPDTIQVITLPSSSELITTRQTDGAGRVWQVIPNIGNPEVATIIAVADPSELIQSARAELTEGIDLDMQETDLSVPTADGMAAILMPPSSAPLNTVPQNCPAWATRLNNCEKIGESYRGYVENEVELDLLLTYHKQQTQSFWGTRQSPSPAKPSTRLMWKSQYVPFDGIPFVNIGSRAVVMECQFGPRRKGSTNKRYQDANQISHYRQTCPARIYIKKVRKFPEFAVDLRQDKRFLRLAMDKAFHELREHRLEGWGQERFYVQLPSEKAHEYHEEDTSKRKYEARMDALENDDITRIEETASTIRRLHPRIVQKIRSLVSAGDIRVYSIRRQLRTFVLRDLSAGMDLIPERHDLTLFPTVNDLKNHIHQALKDIENGTLPLTASTVNVEILPGDCRNGVIELEDGEFKLSAIMDRSINTARPLPETVTVTLTQNPDEEGQHIISKIETHLSDGTTQVSTTLTPETAQLLSKLHPAIFPPGSLLQLGALTPTSSVTQDLASTSSVTQDLASTSSVNAEMQTAAQITDSSGAEVVMAAAEEEAMRSITTEMQEADVDDVCSHMLPHTVSENTVVPLQVTEDEMIIGVVGKEKESVMDSEMITVSVTDDNQLVLSR